MMKILRSCLLPGSAAWGLFTVPLSRVPGILPGVGCLGVGVWSRGSWGSPGSRAWGPVGGLVDNAFVIGFTSPSGGYRGPCVSGP